MIVFSGPLQCTALVNGRCRWVGNQNCVCLRLCGAVEGGRLLKLIGLLILQFRVECFELEISLLGGDCNCGSTG